MLEHGEIIHGLEDYLVEMLLKSLGNALDVEERFRQWNI